MTKAFNAIFGGSDTKIVAAQEQRLAAQDKAIAAQEDAAAKTEAARRRAARMRTSKEASLITGLETGVTKTTLG